LCFSYGCCSIGANLKRGRQRDIFSTRNPIFSLMVKR
jgi:hypothetical protein